MWSKRSHGRPSPIRPKPVTSDSTTSAPESLARTLWLLGYPDQALQIARQTVRGLGATEPVTACIALIWAASIFLWTSDLTSADDCIDRLIQHAERHSLTPYRAVGHGLKGEALIQRKEIETGLDLLCGSLTVLDAEGYQLYA